jgi:hypothetical protein
MCGCGAKQIAELLGTIWCVSRGPKIDSEGANSWMARHDPGHGGFAVARGAIKEVSTAIGEAMLPEPLFPLEERLEIIPDEPLEFGVQNH